MSFETFQLLNNTILFFWSIAYFWVFVEMLQGKNENVSRAKVISLVGMVIVLINWASMMIYYDLVYLKYVQYVLTNGWPWIPSIAANLLYFLFIITPFLAITLNVQLWNYDRKDGRYAAMYTSFSLFTLGWSLLLFDHLILYGVIHALGGVL